MIPITNTKKILQVEAIIKSEDEKKRYELEQNVSYILNIEENGENVEKWLIQKCIGYDNAALNISDFEQNEIANCRALGLLPRGGLAARFWTHSQEKTLDGIAYCFLSLSENYTNLPVHVNGSFTLDNQRRRFWTSTYGEGAKCK